MATPAYRGAPPLKPISYFQPKGGRRAQINSSSSSPRTRRERSPTRRIVAGANLVLGTPRRGDISSQLRNQPETASPRTRLFNVGHARHAEIVRKALSTHDDTARLRRFRQVLQEPAICENERFQTHLDYMRKQHGVLATKADVEEKRRLAAARHERERGMAIRQDYAAFVSHLEEKTAELAATRLQARIRGSLARIRLTKIRALSRLLAPPEEADVINSNGEVDLSPKLMWKSRFVWACQIERKANENAKHFLFLADITPGKVAAKRGGRCVFESVMYDIQEFVPIGFGHGRVEFELRFGINTSERKDASSGWSITFCLLPGDDRSFVGTLECSFWGNRKVSLLPVSSLSSSELAQFPGLVGKHYKSRPT
eukprot:TRINITY_DN87922_c0_g1_i1.p1 TRINITY_DN87922_c0_g1~~TRINITY_DN87922_c0_g1_i1.p1  ORF type:complete len:397 (-),score=37.23 TRINITY_DN87922_c0_g1_i1:260-1372(-)